MNEKELRPLFVTSNIEMIMHNHSSRWASTISDPVRILSEARDDADAGRYEESLTKYLWFHQATSSSESDLGPIRLSFALAEWYQLAKVYPPAMHEMLERRRIVKDKLTRDSTVSEPELFAEFVAFCRILGETSEVVSVFIDLEAHNPKYAESVYCIAQECLVLSGAAHICSKFIDPKAQLNREIEYFRIHRELEFDSRHEKSDFWRICDSVFTQNVVTLVALLVAVNRLGEAKEIAAIAKEEWREGAFHNAIDNALQASLPNCE